MVMHRPTQSTMAAIAQSFQCHLIRGGIHSVLLLAVAAYSCTYESEIQWYWDNGQLSVVAGELNSLGTREGAWLYFDRNGKVQYDHQPGVEPIRETGFYVNGKKSRELRPEELDRLLITAQEIMDRRR